MSFFVVVVVNPMNESLWIHVQMRQSLAERRCRFDMPIIDFVHFPELPFSFSGMLVQRRDLLLQLLGYNRIYDGI